MPRSIKIGLNPLPWVLTPAGFDLSVPVLRTALEVDIPEQEQVAVRADESQPLAIEVLDQDRSVGRHSPGIVGGTAQNGLPRSSERDCGDDAGSAGDEGLHPGHPNQIGQPKCDAPEPARHPRLSRAVCLVPLRALRLGSLR